MLLLSTAYLPPISYVAACFKVEGLVVEQFETYTKQTCRNRCMIGGPNGKQTLSIPVKKVYGNHTKVKDVLLSDSSAWQKIHWRSVETAYNNSPFFLYYKDLFEPFFLKRFDSLVEFNTSILRIVFNALGVEKTIGFTDLYEKTPALFLDKRSAMIGKNTQISLPTYIQCFSERFGFLSNLSIIDLIFNLGPEAKDYLNKIAKDVN
ncbi:MAG: WbqC family protein [Bacteroidetes bacterium]|nr:WbqC family protein [Bacteroidota bacterium]